MTDDRMTEAELREILQDYNRAGDHIAQLEQQRLARRDAGLQRARATGWKPGEIERATGMSREAVRQALNPEVREAARKALAARRAARKDG